MASQKIVSNLKEDWPDLSLIQRQRIFLALPRPKAEELFLWLSPEQQAELLDALSLYEKRSWLRFLPPDDLADLIQTYALEDRKPLLESVDEATRQEVNGLLAYAEDDAGGLMNPLYVRLRPNMTVAEAIRYTRSQAKTKVETIYYAYVLNTANELLGVVSFKKITSGEARKIYKRYYDQCFLFCA